MDDLSDVRKTISGLLTDVGFEVKLASSKNEALQMLDMSHFHVAVLDVRLDEFDEENKDGLLLMHEIKNRYPGTSTIILTGYAEIKMVREALQPDSTGNSPAFGFLEKTEMDRLCEYAERAFAHSLNQNKLGIKDLIAKGEDEFVEFKSGIRWDYKKGGVNKDIQLTIAKSIAGMLNYQGGTLLAGVADDGAIIGIEKDFVGLRKPDSDGFRLILTEIVRNYLGLEHMEFIHVRFETISGKEICVIAIEFSDKPVFLSMSGTSEFWVRVGNSTRQLDVKEATKYIQSHWNKK